MTKINYFQQGGAAPQQDVQKKIIALVQAAMQGDQQATDTINKIMQAAQNGDQQAALLAQMIQEVAKALQQQQATPAARYGAKLQYIHQLNTGCAEDEELVYLAKGGNICPVCQKKAQMKQEKCGGKAVKANKCGGKAKKKYFAEGKKMC